MTDGKFFTEENANRIFGYARNAIDTNADNIKILQQVENDILDLLDKKVSWSDASTSVKKNLLHVPETVVSKTVNGVEFTVNRNENGEVTSIGINGTPSVNTTFVLVGSNSGDALFNIAQKCRLTISPENWTEQGYLCVTARTLDGTNYDSKYSTNYDVEIPDLSQIKYIYLYVNSGHEYNNAIIYPMLRPATIADPTFAPYIPDNEELQAEIDEIVVDKVDWASNGVLSAKNFLHIPESVVSQTINGVEVTVNRNEDEEVTSIIINGKPSAAFNLNLAPMIGSEYNTDRGDHSLLYLPVGNYIASVENLSGEDNAYMLLNNVNGVAQWRIVKPNLTFTVTDSSYPITVGVYIPSGVTVINWIVKPMIRLATDSDSTFQPYSKTNRELTADVKTLKTTVSTPILTTESTEIPDTVEGGLRLVELDGKTEQVTTTGKNLLENTASSQTINGVTFTVNADKSVTVNGTVTVNDYFNFKIGEFTQEMVGKNVIGSCGDTTDNEHIILQFNRPDGIVQRIASGTNDSIAFEVTETGLATVNQGVYLQVKNGSNGVTFNNVIVYPMLRLASITDNTYEPYTGGKPSPSPDYPQAINCAVVDEVRSVGKNLLENTWVTQVVDGVTYTKNDDDTISVSGKSTAQFNGSYCYIGIEYLKAGKYLLSGMPSNMTSNTVNMILRYSDDGNTWVLIQVITSNTPIEFNLTDDKYVRVEILAAKEYQIAGTLTFKPMISKEGGNYEPYRSTTAKLTAPIKLYGKDDIKDKIVKMDGLWKVKREYGRAVFDGSEDEGWALSGGSHRAYTQSLRSYIIKDGFANSEISPNLLYCSNLQFAAANDTYPGHIVGFSQHDANGDVSISIVDDGSTITLADFKTWLASNPVELIYRLANVTYETLPDADQKALNSLKTWDTVTNVFFEHEDVFGDIGSSSAWEQGTIMVGTGDNADNVAGLRTKNYYNISGMNFLNIQLSSNYEMLIYLYDTDKKIMASANGTYSNVKEIKVPNDAVYTRLIIRHSNNTTALTPSIIGSTVNISVSDGATLAPDFTAEYGQFKDGAYATEAKDDTDYLKALIDSIFTPTAGFHNSIYRGKYLGDHVTAAQWEAIRTGAFTDLYIGDYWIINGVTWRIAHFDYWYKCGDTQCTTHHVVIVPDTCLTSSIQMNSDNSTAGGYIGCGLKSGTNHDSTTNTGLSAAATIVNNAFGSAHILNHRMLFTNAVTNGYPSAGGWYDSTVDLMNEPMVYGSYIFTPGSTETVTPYRYTESKTQLALFRLAPEWICIRAGWWLRAVVTAANFANVNAYGAANSNRASNALNVRPDFAIKAEEE